VIVNRASRQDDFHGSNVGGLDYAGSGALGGRMDVSGRRGRTWPDQRTAWTGLQGQLPLTSRLRNYISVIRGARLKAVGLFAGIGGFELGLGSRFEHILLCEIEPRAQAVLRRRFPGIPLWDDVTTLEELPLQTDVVTAGFPCQDLSQAGRTAGIAGRNSGLVAHLFRLLAGHPGLTWVVIENVRNMLVLDRGRAMSYLVHQLESLGFDWAYRVVDTRAFGLPQRRQRVMLVASRLEDPRRVLLPEDAGEPALDRYRTDSFGFYWTEGLRGLGWARDAVPPLKGGSTIGIPSPPAIWIPGAEDGRRIVTPSIEHAELLQGFPRAWTEPEEAAGRQGPRWKMTGNAVSVPVSAWLGERLLHPTGEVPHGEPLQESARWPLAASGTKDGRRHHFPVSMWPRRTPYRHLLDLLDTAGFRTLSHQATAGFASRLERSYLQAPETFRRDLKCHAELTRSEAAVGITEIRH
jgi:DNA (cytosine-5)-methyltransferase 1